MPSTQTLSTLKYVQLIRELWWPYCIQYKSWFSHGQLLVITMLVLNYISYLIIIQYFIVVITGSYIALSFAILKFFFVCSYLRQP